MKRLSENCEDARKRNWEVENTSGLYTANLPLRHTVFEVASRPNRESGLA